MLDLTIGGRVEQLEGHKLDHALSCEECSVFRVLSLFLYQSKDSSVEQCAKSVVVELAHGHLDCQLIIVLDQVLQIIEHLLRVATAQNAAVLVIFSLIFCFDASVKLDFLLKDYIFFTIVLLESNVHTFQLGTVLQKRSESSSAVLGPHFLLVFGLLDGNLFQVLIGSEHLRQRLQALVCQNSDIDSFDVLVCIDSLDNASQSN